VTDYWRQQASPDVAAVGASEQFTRWRDHTSDAIDALAASGALTDLGERFVAQMKRRHSMRP
jgi:uncharacterized protein